MTACLLFCYKPAFAKEVKFIPDTQISDSSDAQDTGISDTKSTDSSDTQNTDISDSKSTDSSDTQSTGISDSKSTDSSDTQNTDLSDNQDSDTSDQKTDATPAEQVTDNSSTQIDATPVSQVSDTPADSTPITTPVNTAPATVVSYAAHSVVKGSLATPIWNQHKIWAKNCSAANHGCGVVCTAMALNLRGKVTTPNATLKQMGRSTKKCKPVLTKDMVACCRKNGVNAVAYNASSHSKNQCISIMKQALNQGKVVAAYVKGAPFSKSTHWILLTGYNTSGKVVVANSSFGYNHVCEKSGKQYHVVTWSTIKKRLIHKKVKYSGFVVIG